MTEDLKLLLARLEDLGADPLSAVKYLKDLRDRAREGIIQEKVSAKEGVMQVLEVYPALELSITKEMSRIYTSVEGQIAKAEAGSGDVAVTVRLVPLEPETFTDDDFYDPELEAE